MVEWRLVYLTESFSWCLIAFSFQDGAVWGLLVRSRVELGRWGENWAPYLQAEITLSCSKRYWNQITGDRTLSTETLKFHQALLVRHVSEFLFHWIFPLSADKDTAESPLSPPHTHPVISSGHLTSIYVQKHAYQLWDERHRFFPLLLLLAACRGSPVPSGVDGGDYKQAILSWYPYSNCSLLAWPAKHLWHSPSLYFTKAGHPCQALLVFSWVSPSPCINHYLCHECDRSFKA